MQYGKHNDNNEFLMLPRLVAPEATAYIQLAYMVVTTVLGWVSLTVEVFIRWNFGERYYSILRVFMATLVLGLVLTLLSIVSDFDPSLTYSTDALSGFLVLFLVMSAIQLLAMRIRRWRGILWHSRSFGLNWLAFLIWRWDWLFYRFIEPGVVFAVGQYVYNNYDGPLGAWLSVAAVALLLKNNVAFLMELERMFDMVDSQIEAMHMRAAMAGEKKSKTAGFSVVRIPNKMVENLQPLDIARTVSQALQQAELVQSQSGD